MAAMELLLAHFSQLEAFISKIAYLNVRSAFLFPLGAGLSDTAPPPPRQKLLGEACKINQLQL